MTCTTSWTDTRPLSEQHGRVLKDFAVVAAAMSDEARRPERLVSPQLRVDGNSSAHTETDLAGLELTQLRELRGELFPDGLSVAAAGDEQKVGHTGWT
jgi:hypothetical protein